MHIRQVHEGMKDFKCELCSAEFTQLGSLKRHMDYLHQDLKKYQCDQCEKAFKVKDDLQKHVRKFHDAGGIKSKVPNYLPLNLSI